MLGPLFPLFLSSLFAHPPPASLTAQPLPPKHATKMNKFDPVFLERRRAALQRCVVIFWQLHARRG